MEYTLVNNLITSVISENPLQKNFLINSMKELDENHFKGLNSYIEFCLYNGIDIQFLAKSYNFIVKETFREQMFFNKHKRYRYATFNEVASSVYMDNDYMKKYMYGLAITSFLWKQHQVMHTFFENHLPKEKSGTFLEIGPGHGYYFMKALTLTAFDHLTAIDISPTSVEMTKEIVKQSVGMNTGKKWDIHQCDFLMMETTNKYDGLVMGEVLEHVENPVAFLKKIHSIVHEDSFVYITTCANAPEIDHLYLFKNEIEVIKMAEDCGFTVKEKLIVPYGNYTVEETNEKELPLNIALTLAKR